MRSIAELLRVYRRRLEAVLANAPSEVIEGLLPSLAPSMLPHEAVTALEQRLPFKLPTSFKAYLTGPRVEPGVEWDELVLPSNSSIDEFSALLSQPKLWRLQLLQFASGPCGDPVCFDASTGDGSDLPVVVINHDRTSADDWEDGVAIRRHISMRWPSFTEFLRALCEGTG